MKFYVYYKNPNRTISIINQNINNINIHKILWSSVSIKNRENTERLSHITIVRNILGAYIVLKFFKIKVCFIEIGVFSYPRKSECLCTI